MSSAAGPRAEGTDGKDHKFRQRVDDHYKLMAGSRLSLRIACRMLLGTTAGCGMRAALAYTAGGGQLPQLVWGALLSIFTMGLAFMGFKAARLQQLRPPLTMFYQGCLLLMLLFLALGGICAGTATITTSAAVAYLILEESVAALGVCSTLYGVKAAGSLQHAFELQAKKRGR